MFGLATADEPFIEIQVRGLEPATNDEAYVLWFLPRRRGFPLPTPLPVQPDGTLSDRIPIPAEILAFASGEVDRDRAQRSPPTRSRDQPGGQVQPGHGEFPGGTVLSAPIRGGG